MSTATKLGRLFGLGADEALHECRHCGTSVDHGGSECPACGSTSIASYDL